MKELDRTLLEQLSRSHAPDCPSVNVLGDFLDGKMTAEKRQFLEAHLQVCPFCTNRLIDLRELARLEREGEEPPQAVVDELKLLVSSQEMPKQSVRSLMSRIAQLFSATWAKVQEWVSPRFMGEVVAALGVAVFVLFLGPSFWQPQPPSSQTRGEQIKAVSEFSLPEQRILQSLSTSPTGPDPLQTQLVATLEKLPKNLLLEETRGATNVEVYKKAAPATVLIVTDQSVGSGAVISSQGEVLTNWHVLQGAKRLAVVFKPQRGVEVRKDLAFAATPIKIDQVADLALLKIQSPPESLPIVRLGSMDEVEVGQDVHAIGHPEGEVWTYTTGIISQVRPSYQWTGADGLLHQSKVVQTQTALNPGNSGGPLLNDRAEIIGINSFRGEGEGLNYAVAVDTVKAFLERTESRTTTPAPRQQTTSYRTESYGTNIIGIYINARVPPPDVWFVYKDSGKQIAYSAVGSRSPTRIDTVALGADPNWQSLIYYIDGDCDGKIDLIGFDSNEDGTPDRFDLPREPFPLVSLAGELAQALENGTIPYSQIRMCR